MIRFKMLALLNTEFNPQITLKSTKAGKMPLDTCFPLPERSPDWVLCLMVLLDHTLSL